VSYACIALAGTAACVLAAEYTRAWRVRQALEAANEDLDAGRPAEALARLKLVGPAAGCYLPLEKRRRLLEIHALLSAGDAAGARERAAAFGDAPSVAPRFPPFATAAAFLTRTWLRSDPAGALSPRAGEHAVRAQEIAMERSRLAEELETGRSRPAPAPVDARRYPRAEAFDRLRKKIEALNAEAEADARALDNAAAEKRPALLDRLRMNKAATTRLRPEFEAERAARDTWLRAQAAAAAAAAATAAPPAPHAPEKRLRELDEEEARLERLP
jgi:hypothetical protein